MITNLTQISILLDGAKDNLNLRLKRLKLQTIARAAKLGADLITNTFMLICVLLAFLFASLTLGFFISSLTSSYAIGFGGLTAFYILVAIMVSMFKTKIIEPQLINFTIRKYLKKYYDQSAE
ncbi:MAG: hypothetical protein EOO96_13810 [Pedobacter sp.]|nr:MAG: hypothetical protein EOO96_13810 [Pedobacter sp.]